MTAIQYANRVSETTTTTGTGAYTLAGAITGYQAFSDAFSTADIIGYCCASADYWEMGRGTLAADGTLERTEIYSGSNGTSAVDWGSGVKAIFCEEPAEKRQAVEGAVTFADGITVTGNVMATGANSKFMNDNGSVYYGTETLSSVRFYVNNLEAGRFHSNSNFGLNEKSPDYLFHGTKATHVYMMMESTLVNGTAGFRFKNPDVQWFCGIAYSGASAANGYEVYQVGVGSRMAITTSGDMLLGTLAKPTANSGKVMVFGENTGDPTLAADTAGIYAKDVAGTAELFAIDAASNATQLSPHNPLTGEWEYYSHNTRTGVTKRVNMERLVSLVEQLSGETLMDVETE